MNWTGNNYLQTTRRALIPFLSIGMSCVQRQLHTLYLTGQARLLMEQHFPEKYAARYNRPPFDLAQMIMEIYQFVEETDWFEPDWETIWRFHGHYQESKGNPDHLGLLLTFLPVRVYGECRADLSWRVRPALYDLLVGKPRSDPIWYHLLHIERNPYQYPPHLVYLPVIARWSVCDNTGNPILDACTSLDASLMLTRPIKQWGQSWFAFTWQNDLEVIKLKWQQAKPMLQMFRQMERWGQTRRNIDKLIRFIETGEGLHELNW